MLDGVVKRGWGGCRFGGGGSGSVSSSGGGNGGSNDQQSSLQEQLRERDQQIQALDRTVQANNDTIRTYKSGMVKMSSSFKQDDYLRRNQINKLKRSNAEYAMKLQALEKTFRNINNTNEGGDGVVRIETVEEDERAETTVGMR